MMLNERDMDSSCPYNIAVLSDGCEKGRDCLTCGWFPLEDHRRRKILRKLAERDCLRKEVHRRV